MTQMQGDFVAGFFKNQEQAASLIEKLMAAAQPRAVFGEPVTLGDYTVITAGEVGAGGGFGSGMGSATKEAPGAEAEGRTSTWSGGGGGGGSSFGRPVAVISIGPNGVEVKQIFDMTKIGLAALTALGGITLMSRKMRRPRG